MDKTLLSTEVESFLQLTKQSKTHSWNQNFIKILKCKHSCCSSRGNAGLACNEVQNLL